jgi:hypothetical protein
LIRSTISEHFMKGKIQGQPWTNLGKPHRHITI